MYALITKINWFYSNKSSINVELFNELENAQAHIHSEKSPEIIKRYNGTTTWMYPPYSNGEETFDEYITDDVVFSTDLVIALGLEDFE